MCLKGPKMHALFSTHFMFPLNSVPLLFKEKKIQKWSRADRESCNSFLELLLTGPKPKTAQVVFFNGLQYPSEPLDGAWCIGNLKRGGSGWKEGISQKQKSMTEGHPLSEWILNSEQLYHFASNCPSHAFRSIYFQIPPHSSLFFAPPFPTCLSSQPIIFTSICPTLFSLLVFVLTHSHHVQLSVITFSSNKSDNSSPKSQNKTLHLGSFLVWWLIRGNL